jgi:hypothetical protein
VQCLSRRADGTCAQMDTAQARGRLQLTCQPPPPPPPPAPVLACPAGSYVIGEGSRYCGKLLGQCHGPQGVGSHVNRRYRYDVHTETACMASCDAEPACVGFAYAAAGFACAVYGPGVEKATKPPWLSDHNAETAIGGADGSPAFVCVPVAQKPKPKPNGGGGGGH